MSKVQRQATISRLIGDHEVTNQPQLIELLADQGIEATQATVSRDLEEIGAVKVRTSHGETAYAIPEFEHSLDELTSFMVRTATDVIQGLDVLM